MADRYEQPGFEVHIEHAKAPIGEIWTTEYCPNPLRLEIFRAQVDMGIYLPQLHIGAIPFDLIQVTEDGIGTYYDPTGLMMSKLPWSKIHSITCGFWPGSQNRGVARNVAIACADMVQKIPSRIPSLDEIKLCAIPERKEPFAYFRIEVRKAPTTIAELVGDELRKFMEVADGLGLLRLRNS